MKFQSDNPVKALRQLRERKGWTLEHVADLLAVPPRTLRSWEYGTRRPKRIVLRVIERFIRRHA